MPYLACTQRSRDLGVPFQCPCRRASSDRFPPSFHFGLKSIQAACVSTSCRRYAVLGAGFAGLSVAWHLLQLSNKSLQISVDVFDEQGIGGGASGVSGGLLHPYTPKGKHKDIAGLSCIDGAEANALLPGLAISSNACALHIREGLNIDPLRYLQGLWRACELYVEHRCNAGQSFSSAVLQKLHVPSLSGLPDDYDAVVVCLGAGVSKLEELSGKLPLTYCRGVVAHLSLPPGEEEHSEYKGPSILGDTWIAAQGTRNLVLGATKDWDNSDTTAILDAKAAASACNELFAKASAFYPSIKKWSSQKTHAGVRVMAPRTAYGKVPLAGCIDELLYCRPSRSPYYWYFGGLGSRGLIYHAWVGKKVAEAVVFRSESCLPRELLLWKSGRKL